MRRIDADELKYTISSGMCTDSITFSILLGMQNGNTNLDETTDKIVREHIKEVNRLIDNAPTVDTTEEYLKGYLQGCEDTIKKVNELQKIQVHIPYGRGTKMERSEEE